MNLSTLTASALIGAYNGLTGESVKRFSTRANAERRLAQVLEAKGVVLTINEDGSIETALKDCAAPEELPVMQVEQGEEIDAEWAAKAAKADALAAEIEAPVKSRFADMPAIESKGGPGLARLRASKAADAIREMTIAEGQKARDEAAARAEAARQIAVDEPAAIEVEPRLAPAVKARKYAGEARIAEVVANPKKPGSRSFLAFAQYRVGQTVAEFAAACAAVGLPEKEARSNVSWDARKGFIRLETGAVATNRPGDAAAVYAEETGVDYARALVACNMD